LSSIDPQQAALRAAQEAQRRVVQEAQRRAVEGARELARRLSAALQSRQEPATKEVASVLRDAAALAPEGRTPFLQAAATPRGPISAERAAEVLHERIEGEAGGQVCYLRVAEGESARWRT
jgi:hypothetical protein